MLTLEVEQREGVLAVYRSEIERLKMEHDEHLITGLHFLMKGEIGEASNMLAKLDSVDRQLTYIRSCLESEYKQVVYLH